MQNARLKATPKPSPLNLGITTITTITYLQVTH
jgi:hypothetical protein